MDGFFKLSYLSIAFYDVFIAAKLHQSHRTSGMKLLGGNAHLTAKTELSAVGETGSDIHIYRSTIHTLCKIVRILFRFCNDSLAVATGMKGNMLRCRFHIIYHFYREDIIQKFRIEVLPVFLQLSLRLFCQGEALPESCLLRHGHPPAVFSEAAEMLLQSFH